MIKLSDLEMLKQNIKYNPITGSFFRVKTPQKPMALCWQHKNATMPVKNGDKKKYFTAWRVAIYFEKGFYPAPEDAVIFKDGDNTNFRIKNIEVSFPNPDEQTILDFATEYGLSPQTVNFRMKGATRFERMVNTSKVFYYYKKELMKRCASLMKNGNNIYDYDYDDEVIQIKKMDLNEQKRGNKMVREFLKVWIGDKPTKWEMTLCQ